jgi:cytochrome c oxidase assembly factor CtaG
MALASPLDALSDRHFSAHMAQHLLLTQAAGPLLALGAPARTVPWVLNAVHPRGAGVTWRLPIVRTLRLVLSSPLAAGLLAGAVLWGWHLPRLYQAALNDPMVHASEHGSLLATAFIFWQAVLPPGGPQRGNAGRNAAAIILLGLQGNILGALLVFSRTAWYPAYLAETGIWGLTPLEDQQLAGLAMWIPGSAISLGIALALLTALLRRPNVGNRSPITAPPST